MKLSYLLYREREREKRYSHPLLMINDGDGISDIFQPVSSSRERWDFISFYNVIIIPLFNLDMSSLE